MRSGCFGGHHDAAVPLVHRQRDELGVGRDHLGRDRHVGLAREHLVADLRGVALVDEELDLGVAPLERHRLRQRIARLGVRRTDGQGAELVVGELLAGAAQVARLGEDALGDRDHRLSGLGDRDQALAAHEHFDAELVLEGADLLDTPAGRCSASPPRTR